MRSLVLTLGHNSSAILVDDGNIVCGYEEERLSGIKSDSSFPLLSIRRINDLYHIQRDISICVGHWFLDGKLPEDDLRHWDVSFIKSWFPQSKISSITPTFSHHDSHMCSAEVFAGKDFQQDHHTFVVDGFGTNGECFSVYQAINGESKLIHRIHGFRRSIGLFYQYATDFCGMKMHQDEWKMLGYESHMDKKNADRLDIIAELVISAMEDIPEVEESSIDNLFRTKTEMQEFLRLLKDQNRVEIAYLIQKMTEVRLQRLFCQFDPSNLLVVGGCFLNVKLNSILADMTPGKFCAMPLAGD